MLVNPKYNENKLTICILIPGFIKSYTHLSYLEKLFKSISADKIYVFGHIFNYMIPPNINKEKIVYDNINDKIDSNKLTIFDSFSYVSDNYTKYDKEGYDNRIYSQKNNIKCDMFIRMRSDLHISDITRLNNIITQSYISNKIIFFTPSCHIVNDQLFIGPYTLFNKIMLLSDNIYDYYLLDDIKKRIVHHKTIHNKKNYNKELRFGGESEILLWKHINICLKKIDYLLINSNKLFSIKIN
jgi:hypothetical protein